MIEILVVTAGQELQSFSKRSGVLRKPFAIRILANDFDDFAHVQAILRASISL